MSPSYDLGRCMIDGSTKTNNIMSPSNNIGGSMVIDQSRQMIRMSPSKWPWLVNESMDQLWKIIGISSSMCLSKSMICGSTNANTKNESLKLFWLTHKSKSKDQLRHMEEHTIL